METLTPIIWITIGIICLIFEITTVQGIGFLFLGLGSLTTGITIFILPMNLCYQISLMGCVSFLWFLILWRPIKNFLYNIPDNHSKKVVDIVGSQVEVVEKNILPNQNGSVIWSGTVMNARLSDDTPRVAHIGDILYVKAVRGNVLICQKNNIIT